MGKLDDKPFGVTSADGSMGDQGVAIKRDIKFDGGSGAKKFDGDHKLDRNVSARQMQNQGLG